MITHLRGRLVEKTPTGVVIECNGVGYFVNISLNTFSQLPDNENIYLLTYLQVKEDSHQLFGFINSNERDIFKLLISVSGIGTNTARTMLSSLTPKQIRDGISSENVALIQSVKGIGLKTAQRVIIELRDKILKVYGFDETISDLNNTKKDEALSALEVLGFSKKQSDRVVVDILKNIPDASVELIIKEALKNL
ncbi:MAG: Holliday junction branch migration protein RuvA [Flavobacteriaceae bacterium]|jgi:Holliday junction DNA helicase RuvA